MAVKFDWVKYMKGQGILPGINIWKHIIKSEAEVTQRAIREMEKEIERKKGQAIGAQLAGQEVAKGITHLVNYVIRNKDNRVVSVANTPEEARLMLESLGVNPKAIKEESFETHKETHLPQGFTVYNQVERGKKPKYLTIGKLPNLFAISSPLAITASLATGLPPGMVSRESTVAPPTPVSILSESEEEGEKGGKEEIIKKSVKLYHSKGSKGWTWYFKDDSKRKDVGRGETYEAALDNALGYGFKKENLPTKSEALTPPKKGGKKK